LNLATPKLEWGLLASKCFHDAGGDIVELNVHGGYQPYLSQGKLKAMVLPANRAELYKWVEAFSETNVPFIVKFRAGFIEDYTPILDRIKEFDILGIHFNVADEEKKRPDINFLNQLGKARYLLLISGYARSRGDVEKLFDAGADMVGIASPTMDNASFIKQILPKQ
jgi:tRNA-dihydrouridine synthase